MLASSFDRIASPFQAGADSPAITARLLFKAGDNLRIALIVAALHGIHLLLPGSLRGRSENCSRHRTDDCAATRIARPRDHRTKYCTRRRSGNDICPRRWHGHDLHLLMRRDLRLARIESTLLHRPRMAFVSIAIELRGALPCSGIHIHLSRRS